jgi:hypothetical protein
MALTNEEFAKLTARLANQQNGSNIFSNIDSISTPTPSFGQRVSTDLAKRGEAVNNLYDSNQNFGSKTLQLIGQGAGFAGDIVGEAVKSVGDITGLTENVVKPIGTAILNTEIGKAGLKAIEGGVESYNQFKQNNPEVAGNLEAVLNIGSLIPIGKGAQVAGKGALRAGEAGLETAVKGATKTGALTKDLGEKVYKSAFDLTADEARMVQGNKINIGFLEKELAKVPKGSEEAKSLIKQIEKAKTQAPIVRADTALEKGITGTEKGIGLKSGVEKLDLWKNTVEPALKSSDTKITKDELFAKARETVAKEAEPTRRKGLQDALEALEEDYKDFVDTDLLKANEIKTSLANFTPSKIFKGQEVASGVKTLQADLASAIREKTYSALKDKNIRKAYIDYGNLKQLEKVGIKALTEGGTKGGFGGFWTTVYDRALTPVKTIGGKVLYRVGDKLEFTGQKGLKTLRDYLNTQGVKIKKT